MRDVVFVVKVVDQAIDWCSSDFDAIEDALDELCLCLEDGVDVLRLRFASPLSFGSSLPRLWQQVVRVLSDYTGQVVVDVPSLSVASHFERYLPTELKVHREYLVGSMRVCVTVGDISQAKADVIVNASNRRLELGGGVSHALRSRFGEDLQHQMWSRSTQLDDGQLIVTTHGAQTGVKCIYHVASARGDATAIALGVQNIFVEALVRHHRNIISPLLGTGTGGLPVVEFAAIVHEQAQRSAYDGLLQLWCWTKSDFDEVCAVLDALVSVR